MKKYLFCCNLFAIISFCLLLYSVSSKTFLRSANVSKKIIIDTDAGADDAVAIFLTLKSEDNVLAITCSYGNTYMENVVINVLKILTVANRSDIPVYKGAHKALINGYNEYTEDNYFGSDGLGDFNFIEEITAKVDESKHAAVALIDLVKQYPYQITLLSIGPSTNVATAIALEPLFLTYLKNHVVLGSSVSGVGNISPNIEFNFYQDPEGNYMILNKNTTSVLLPWETAINSYITTDWRINVLGKINSSIVNFLNKAERKSLTKSNSWSISDGMAAAIMLQPQLVTRSIITNVSPVIDGLARGSVLVDYTNLTGKPKNAKIVQAIDTDGFQQLLLDKFS
ncbi:pyrimidine-specific ribonucleoside hydrolase RihA isoform X1 [Bombus impatiens]|uniref:Pyrimidine-specific ribonucleoside hydrolase RihA isoform X1 n=1 Tax=Bombus impatiens TaxID=132113 RepID=A0A6P8LXG8_BOMIM|nr:pyrimidine-specific ribonucleoside hydrolase RihA isoform X1 [Bombus impatiens]XP_033179179.1 pyrimidine-specific ribonucleoside hydrolase RihA isoform X1 [Bombus impatiens]